MEYLLCGEISVMRALFGIVPTAYLCGRSFDEYNIVKAPPLPIVHPPFALLRYRQRPLIPRWTFDVQRFGAIQRRLLFKILCDKMFSHESGLKVSANRWYQYNRRSYAALLEFLKGGVDANSYKCVSYLLNPEHFGLVKHLSFHDSHEITLLLRPLSEYTEHSN